MSDFAYLNNISENLSNIVASVRSPVVSRLNQNNVKYLHAAFLKCCSQDEQSSVAMLKKHQILEQAVEDYAETVHQLSKTSRGLVAANHPERSRTPFHTESQSQSDITFKTKNITFSLFSKHISTYGSDFEYNRNLILTLELALILNLI